jgi:hypothetical protein
MAAAVNDSMTDSNRRPCSASFGQAFEQIGQRLIVIGRTFPFRPVLIDQDFAGGAARESMRRGPNAFELAGQQSLGAVGAAGSEE